MTPAAARLRAADIKRIHVLRGRLGMDDSAYRDLIGALFAGRRSSTELDDAQRTGFVRHLQQLADAQGNPPVRRQPLTPRQGKMYSLWQQLADAGLVRDRRMSALNAWIETRVWLGRRVDSKQWLDGHREDQVIEALKRWLKRGKDVPGDG